MSTAKSWETCITYPCKGLLQKLIKAELKKDNPKFGNYKEIKNEDELKAWAENVVEHGNKTLLAKWFGCLIGQCSPSEKITTDIIDMVKIVKTGNGDDEWSKSVINNCKKDYDKWIDHFKHGKRGNRAEKCDTERKKCLDQEEDQCVSKYAECIVGDGRDRTLGNWVGCQILRCKEYPQQIKQDIIDTLETLVKVDNKIESTLTDDLSFI